MKVFITRLEGDSAVVETENNALVTMPRALIPPEAKAGSVLIIALESAEKKTKHDSTSALIGELWKD